MKKVSNPKRLNTWRKVTSAGNYDSWIEYQKRILKQVQPDKKLKYKKGV